MFAIIQTGGKQYKVKRGSKLDIEKIEGATEDQEIILDRVLLINNGGKVSIGTPLLEASVKAKILGNKRGEKIVVFKMKPKKRYQKKQGHRQNLTTIEVIEINESRGQKSEKPKSEKPKIEKSEIIKVTPKSAPRKTLAKAETSAKIPGKASQKTSAKRIKTG